jgi:hypothetical protein
MGIMARDQQDSPKANAREAVDQAIALIKELESRKMEEPSV